MDIINSANEKAIKTATILGNPQPKKVSRSQFKHIKLRIDGLKKGIIHYKKIINKYNMMQVKGQQLTDDQKKELALATRVVNESRTILDDFVYEMVKRKALSPIANKIATRKGYATVSDYLASKSNLKYIEDSYQKAPYRGVGYEKREAKVNSALYNVNDIAYPYDLSGRVAPTIGQQEAFLSAMPDNLVDRASRHR